MTTENLDLNWQERFPEWATRPADYLELMRAFAKAAIHSFRSESVFLATPLTGLDIQTTDDLFKPERRVKQKAETFVLRFDNDRYAHPKDRESAVLQIYENAARHRLTAARLNNPDFMGPDIWSWDEKQWNKELKFLVQDPNDPGRFIFTDEGWGQTARMIHTAPVKTAVAFPYNWGNTVPDPFEGKPGCTLAGFQREIGDIAKAVAEIDARLASIDPATLDYENIKGAIIVQNLFKYTEALGAYVTRFDVYPQKEGFAAANFHDEAAHEKARAREGSLVRLFIDETRRTMKYGRPGHRALVPDVAEIAVMMAKLARQEQDGPHIRAA